MSELPKIAIVGLGEVGFCFAQSLMLRGVRLAIASRASERADSAARRLGVRLEHDVANVVPSADIVLLTVTGDSLRNVVQQLAAHVREDTLIADLTSADPQNVIEIAGLLGSNAPNFVDVAIMGAVSLHGLRTPLLASGVKAERFAESMNAIGFDVSARAGSAVGDASRLKLLRSIFAKGLDAVVIESMLAAEAFGLRDDLIALLADYDRKTLREHIDMYLRTHPPHAARRLVEMKLAERQLVSLGIPSITTRATIDRYQRSVDLVKEDGASSESTDAVAALQWLLSAERRRTSSDTAAARP